MGCWESKQEAKAEEKGEPNKENGGATELKGEENQAADNGVEEEHKNDDDETKEENGENQNNTNSNVNEEAKEGNSFSFLGVRSQMLNTLR